MHKSWMVVAVLCLVTGVAYLTRTDIAVAQERMAPALVREPGYDPPAAVTT